MIAVFFAPRSWPGGKTMERMLIGKADRAENLVTDRRAGFVHAEHRSVW
jgi:hypothetical protein